MKILCIEQFRELGGGQMCLLELLPALRERGWEPVVAIPGEGTLAKRVRELGCQVELFDVQAYPHGKKRRLDLFRYAAEAPKLTQRIAQLTALHQIDLLYVNAPRMLPVAAFAARWRSTPLVFHCHNRVTQPSAVRLLGASLKVARARVISCCHYSVELLRPYLPKRSLSIVYNGVADSALAQSAPGDRQCRIGVIGRIEPEKGQIHFVAAARLLLRSHPNWRFVVIGAPQFSGTRYLDRVLKLSRGFPIEFREWQPDVASVLASLDLLAVPSTSVEAMPRVILEAFAAGVPVVAFPSGGIPEIVRDGYNGFLTSRSTAEALAERMSFVMRLDETVRQSVIANARNCWQNRHTLERFRRDVCNVIALALARAHDTGSAC